MMLFWKAGLVFLAVPKTGTQAFEAVLGDSADILLRHPPAVKHMTAQRFRRKFAPLLPPPPGGAFQSVAVIRAPVDWLGSWFRYRGRSQIDGHPNSTAGLGFDAFVEGYLSEAPPPWARIGSQHRFVTDGGGTVLTDYLFPYEAQAPLRAFLSERLGREVPPAPRRNVSPARPLELSGELESRLRAERPEEFALHEAVSAGAHLPR